MKSMVWIGLRRDWPTVNRAKWRYGQIQVIKEDNQVRVKSLS